MFKALCCVAVVFAIVGRPVFAEDAKQADGALGFTVKSIDGKEVNLAKYKGKVVVIVNVASQCGLTPQYEGLESLYEKYGEKGLAVLGFPCNQFGEQEPGTEKEIAAFCKDNYGVKFDMFAKVDVNGEKASDLYKYLTNLETAPKGSGKISWNFEKFVINREGNVIARFKPQTEPTDAELIAVIEKSLEEKTK